MQQFLESVEFDFASDVDGMRQAMEYLKSMGGDGQ
jgi:hypothetical protein